MKEASLVLIKPDGIQKQLIGDVLSRLVDPEIEIIAARMCTVSRELAEVHYEHLKDRDFFEELVKFITGGYHLNRVLALVYYGENAISVIREKCGATNPEDAHPTSIRGSYGRITTKGVFENVIHASANKADAQREIKLWFEPHELTVPNVFPTTSSQVKQTLQKWS